MRTVVLFIAMSLDGYIADRTGGVKWLDEYGEPDDSPDAYSVFIQDIDTVVMGWNTYHQIATELSPSEWVYQDMTSYVVTHHPEADTDEIKFVCGDPSDLVKKLKRQAGKDIWVCGGAAVAQTLMRDGLIDRFHISIIPILLGDGIRLFGGAAEELPLKLIRSESKNGIIDAVYEPR